MKKEKKTFKQKLASKVENKLKDVFNPMLERYCKASYSVLIVHETKLKKQKLTTFEEFMQEVKETLLNGGAENEC